MQRPGVAHRPRQQPGRRRLESCLSTKGALILPAVPGRHGLAFVPAGASVCCPLRLRERHFAAGSVLSNARVPANPARAPPTAILSGRRVVTAHALEPNRVQFETNGCEILGIRYISIPRV
jgi:hypothetical protein